MLNLMIVDDEELICQEIKSKISRIAHPSIGNIELTTSAIEAKDMILMLKTDIVISDIRMPDIDGLTLIRECAQINPEIRFIVLSGYDDYDYVREAFKYGIVDYLLKPVKLSELETQLNNAIKLCNHSKPQENKDITELKQTDNTQQEQTLISIVKQYIESRPNCNATLTEVSNLVSMNYTYFSTWFKDETGQTFSAYIMKHRMEKAIRLLKDPTLRINEIAAQVGYDNMYHFSRAFKNYCGQSPTELRKQFNINQA